MAVKTGKNDEYQHGIFVISLDFELHWGVSDHRTIESYRENLEGVPEVVERLLKVFSERNIHATWATVGMLMGENKTQLLGFVPKNLQPTYENPRLSNFPVLQAAGDNILQDPFHYALPLVKKIQQTEGQEIGCHTFSHFYCLEKGIQPEQLHADLLAARNISEPLGIDMQTIIFPRNQYNDVSLEICKSLKFKVFRGNIDHWIHHPRVTSVSNNFQRMSRLLDVYFNISGNNAVSARRLPNGMVDIPASRFLRPHSKLLSLFDPLRLRRMKKEMTFAAKNAKIYHIWWHPHNFGKHIEDNFAFLEKLLDHFDTLRQLYGFQSLNMLEISNNLNSTKSPH